MGVGDFSSRPTSRPNGDTVAVNGSKHHRGYPESTSNGRTKASHEDKHASSRGSRSRVNGVDLESKHRSHHRTERRKSRENGEPSASSRQKNRHEVESWKRSHDDRGIGKRLNSSHISSTKTESSVSKNTGSSGRASVSSSASSVSTKAKKYSKKQGSDLPSSRATTRSSTSADAGPSQKRLKVKLEAKRPSPVKQEKTVSNVPVNGRASARKPSAIPAGDWTVQFSRKTGKTYYYNAKTKETQWAIPPELQAAQTASVPNKDVDSVNVSKSRWILPASKDVVGQSSSPSKSKRKVDEVISPEKSGDRPKIPRLTRKAEVFAVMLGSPISDDDEETRGNAKASSGRSEEMDISDAAESISSSPSPSPSPVAGSSHSTRSTRRPSAHDIKLPPEKILPSDMKKSRPPTVDDLRKLNASQDPESRKHDKLQRVEKWIRLESSIDVFLSPGDDVSLSPVSSDGSLVSHRSSSPRQPDSPVISSSLHLDDDSALPSAASPSPMPHGVGSKIAVPIMDLPEAPAELPDSLSFFSPSFTSVFRSMKIEAVEDQRCKLLFESHPAVYCRVDEKEVMMKSNVIGLRYFKGQVALGTEEISFWSEVEDEIKRSMTAKAEPKPVEASRIPVKAEPLDLEIKEEPAPETAEAKLHVPSSDNFPKTLEMSA